MNSAWIVSDRGCPPNNSLHEEYFAVRMSIHLMDDKVKGCEYMPKPPKPQPFWIASLNKEDVKKEVCRLIDEVFKRYDDDRELKGLPTSEAPTIHR